MNAKTINTIALKNPKFSKEAIKLVITYHLSTINKKMTQTSTVDLPIPKLGRIHTHKNAVNPKYKKIYANITKWKKNINDFSAEVLLF